MQGDAIIGYEILRLRQTLARADMGSTRRREVRTRLNALEWALHALLTGDRSTPPGEAVEAFLSRLDAHA